MAKSKNYVNTPAAVLNGIIKNPTTGEATRTAACQEAIKRLVALSIENVSLHEKLHDAVVALGHDIPYEDTYDYDGAAERRAGLTGSWQE